MIEVAQVHLCVFDTKGVIKTVYVEPVLTWREVCQPVSSPPLPESAEAAVL